MFDKEQMNELLAGELANTIVVAVNLIPGGVAPIVCSIAADDFNDGEVGYALGSMQAMLNHLRTSVKDTIINAESGDATAFVELFERGFAAGLDGMTKHVRDQLNMFSTIMDRNPTDEPEETGK